MLERVTRLAQRCKQRDVQGQVRHARAKSLGPSGLARCHAAKGLLALLQKLSQLFGFVERFEGGIRQGQDCTLFHLRFNRLGTNQVAMERQHVDPLWKLFSFRYGGADIDEVVANGLSSLSQSSDIGVCDSQLFYLGRVVIEPLVELCLLQNLPGHLFRAD